MAKITSDDGGELDFTEHFSPAQKVPEPQYTAEQLSHIDDLGVIGETALKSSGFYTRIVSAVPSGRSRTPSECNVLVVEDNDGTAMVIVKVLEKFGYHAKRAANGAEIASAMAASPLPDLVLLDVMLPDIDGFDVLNRVKHHPTLNHIPVMMLTSKSERLDIARGLALGAVGYITKPVLPSTLIDAVQAILAG